MRYRNGRKQVAERHTHCLRRTHGYKQPTQIAALVADIQRDADLDSATWREYRCNSCWIAWGRRTRGGKLRAADSEYSPTCAQLPLKALCKGNRGLWLFVPDMYRTLTAIRLLDDIGRDWLLEESSTPSLPEFGLKARGKFKGFCVLEPTCGILVLRHKDGGIIHIVDTAQYGLENVSELRGLHDKGSVLPKARNDVLNVLYWADWYIKWLEYAGIGPLKHTLASQAYYGWRKNCLDYPVMVHTDTERLKAERAALYGGRCECYFVGQVSSMSRSGPTAGYYGNEVQRKLVNGPIYHLDATSLYAGVVCAQKIPSYPWLEGNYSDSINERTEYCRVCDVTVETQSPKFPLRLNDDTVIWPVGRFRTTLAGPELALLDDSDRVTVHAEWGYAGYDLFTAFTQTLHSERLRFKAEGNVISERIVKRMLQSLFGKFAQVRRGWVHVPNCAAPSPWSLWHRKSNDGSRLDTYRCIAGRVERHERTGEPPESIPVITAWVYSLARAWMWLVQCLAGREHVFYCDTDSVFVDRAGYERLRVNGMVVQNELGRLRVVSEYSRVEFIGIKHYVADGELTCAGLAPIPGSTGLPPGKGYIPEPLTTAAASGRSPSRLEYPHKGARHTQYRHGAVHEDGSVTPILIGREAGVE